jgi:hypothetical protein
MLRRNLPGGLTKAAIKNAKPKERPHKLYDGGGLFLEVTVKGSKYWKYRYRANGQDTCVTLGLHGGAVGCINADLARALAVKAREVRKGCLGSDPNTATSAITKPLF